MQKSIHLKESGGLFHHLINLHLFEFFSKKENQKQTKEINDDVVYLRRFINELRTHRDNFAKTYNREVI